MRPGSSSSELNNTTTGQLLSPSSHLHSHSHSHSHSHLSNFYSAVHPNQNLFQPRPPPTSKNQVGSTLSDLHHTTHRPHRRTRPVSAPTYNNQIQQQQHQQQQLQAQLHQLNGVKLVRCECNQSNSINYSPIRCNDKIYQLLWSHLPPSLSNHSISSTQYTSFQFSNLNSHLTRINLPSTVIFTPNRPVQWFFTPPNSSSSSSFRWKRKRPINITPDKIFLAFQRAAQRLYLTSHNCDNSSPFSSSRCEIIAQFIYNSEQRRNVVFNENGNEGRQEPDIVYLTLNTLRQLLFEINFDFDAPQLFGVLQLFIPTGETNQLYRVHYTIPTFLQPNHQLSPKDEPKSDSSSTATPYAPFPASSSIPSPLISVSSVRNCLPLTNRHFSVAERCVTFDSPIIHTPLQRQQILEKLWQEREKKIKRGDKVEEEIEMGREMMNVEWNEINIEIKERLEGMTKRVVEHLNLIYSAAAVISSSATVTTASTTSPTSATSTSSNLFASSTSSPVSPHSALVSELELYFKIDERGDVYLQWCSKFLHSFLQHTPPAPTSSSTSSSSIPPPRCTQCYRSVFPIRTSFVTSTKSASTSRNPETNKKVVTGMSTEQYDEGGEEKGTPGRERVYEEKQPTPPSGPAPTRPTRPPSRNGSASRFSRSSNQSQHQSLQDPQIYNQSVRPSPPSSSSSNTSSTPIAAALAAAAITHATHLYGAEKTVLIRRIRPVSAAGSLYRATETSMRRQREKLEREEKQESGQEQKKGAIEGLDRRTKAEERGQKVAPIRAKSAERKEAIRGRQVPHSAAAGLSVHTTRATTHPTPSLHPSRPASASSRLFSITSLPVSFPPNVAAAVQPSRPLSVKSRPSSAERSRPSSAMKKQESIHSPPSTTKAVSPKVSDVPSLSSQLNTPSVSVPFPSASTPFIPVSQAVSLPPSKIVGAVDVETEFTETSIDADADADADVDADADDTKSVDKQYKSLNDNPSTKVSAASGDEISPGTKSDSKVTESDGEYEDQFEDTPPSVHRRLQMPGSQHPLLHSKLSTQLPSSSSKPVNSPTITEREQVYYEDDNDLGEGEERVEDENEMQEELEVEIELAGTEELHRDEENFSLEDVDEEIEESLN